MPSPRARLRTTLLLGLLGGVALVFLPRGLPPKSDPARASAASEKTSRHPLRVATPPPPPDSVFTLPDETGRPVAYAVALDELYFPARAPSARLEKLPARADLADLLAHAATFQTTPDASAPRLVLYPLDAPRNSRTRRIVNPRVDVRLASASAPLPAARPDLGLVAWERPPYAPDHALARVAGDAAQALRAAAALAAIPDLRSARPLLARQHFPRHVPNDPLFKDQWHLQNTGQQGGKKGADIRAVPAWDTSTGASVTIGVVDDGFDLGHPDLAPAFVTDLGQDWNDNDDDPAAINGGAEGDSHGTAVAGLAAARGDNAVGVAGSAPSARLAGLRLIAAPSDDEEDAEAMAWRTDVIAVKNNSWGPPDAYEADDIPPDLYAPGPLWRAAVLDAVAQGREGRGTLFVFSAGNGQADQDQGAKDGYSSLRQVIPVAALTPAGIPASFSEGGTHLVVAAPGDARIGLATTDRRGDEGYNTATEGYPGDYIAETDYTRAFAGTSAAAPVLSGVCALLLDARPELGWRDVKEIFLRSSTKIGLTTDWVSRPGGRPALPPIKHHPRLGGGLVNAEAAVALAKSWQPLPAEETYTAPAPEPAPRFPVALPDAGGAITLRFQVPATKDFRIEHVSVIVDITHPARGDLDLQLRSPSGAISRLVTPTYADLFPDYPNWTFNSVRHWGEAAAGLWTLTVRDAHRADLGRLNSARLEFHGHTPPAPVFVGEPRADQTLTTGSTLLLAAPARGHDLVYEWYRGATRLARGEVPTLRIAAVSARDAGVYRCVVTNPRGSVTSRLANLTLDDTPLRTIATHVGVAQTIDLSDLLASTDTLKIAGLPPGLKFDRATSALIGRVTRAGSWSVAITTTAAGDATRSFIRVAVAATYSERAGSYAGPVPALPPAYKGGPADTLRITLAANGSFSGSLRLGSTATPFTGRFVNSPNAGVMDASVKLAAAKLILALRSDGDGGVGFSLRASNAPASSAPLATGLLAPAP